MKLRSSLFAFMAACLALLTAIAVPQGMMPVWGADGFSVTLCSPEHGSELKIDRGDDGFETLRLIEQAKRIANGEIPAAEHDGASNAQGCAFSGVAGGAAPIADIAQIMAPVRMEIWATAPHLTLSVLRRQHLPPATGPPSPFENNLNI